jgi:hypothetical protein
MNRLSFRVILFIVVLSALHVAAIAPLKVSAIQRPQEIASQTYGPSPGGSFLAPGQQTTPPQGRSADK